MSLWPTTIVLFISLLLQTTRLDAAASSTVSTKHRREVIEARHGAVATDDGRCSRIGMGVLREGGHAVDAAVAAAFCLGVVSPASSGIGGGAFMLVRLASGKPQVYDMRETAPLLASEVNFNSFYFTQLVALSLISFACHCYCVIYCIFSLRWQQIFLL